MVVTFCYLFLLSSIHAALDRLSELPCSTYMIMPKSWSLRHHFVSVVRAFMLCIHDHAYVLISATLFRFRFQNESLIMCDRPQGTTNQMIVGSCQCCQQSVPQIHPGSNVCIVIVARSLKAERSRCGLVFFGTPHAGGNEALVTLGKTCARIVTALSTNPSNDIMEAVQLGSLFSDVLQENWRHQLTSYKIVSFYEGIGSVCDPGHASPGRRH